MLKEISGSTTIEPSVSTPSTLNTCRQIVQKTLSIEKFPTSYSGSVALVASAFHPLKTSSSTGDLGSQTIIRGCLHFLQSYLFILRRSLTLTGPSGPSASADGLGGGESLRQAPFLIAASRLAGAVMFSSSSSGLPIFPYKVKGR